MPLVKIRLFPSESGRRACISYAARRAFDASLIPRSLFQVPAAAPAGSGLRDQTDGDSRVIFWGPAMFYLTPYTLKKHCLKDIP